MPFAPERMKATAARPVAASMPIAGRRSSRPRVTADGGDQDTPSAEVATLQPEVRDFDPLLALDGGKDGLDFYRMLATTAPAWLIPGGQLLAEFGEGQGPELRALFEAQGWCVEAILPDDTGRERMLHVRLA